MTPKTLTKIYTILRGIDREDMTFAEKEILEYCKQTMETFDNCPCGAELSLRTEIASGECISCLNSY